MFKILVGYSLKITKALYNAGLVYFPGIINAG